MRRRRFIRKLYTGPVSTALSGLLGSCAAGGREDDHTPIEEEHAYIPLNGRSIKDMADRKVHHGPERFQNPFTSVPKGDIWRVIQWKLSKNHFKHYYQTEPVRPVTLDLERIREEPPGLVRHLSGRRNGDHLSSLQPLDHA